MRALIVIGCLVLMAGVAAQHAPRESEAALQAASGLEARLWAAEPMFANPTNIAVDERGRVWVLEAVNYRKALRNQPDLRDGDRIVILEDTDLDGVADKTTVFDQGPHLRAPLGLAVLGNKVYVSQSPDVVVYTKDEHDRVLHREVLLTGFGGVDHDHGVHAITFGPDGRLYFNHGDTGFHVTDRSGRTFQSATNDEPDLGYYKAAAFRMQPNGTNLEVLAQNFRNPYELVVDSFGNVFQSDNDDDGNAWTRLSYVMEGGNFGYFGPRLRSWQADRGSHFHNELPGVVPNMLRLGPGSPSGLAIYEGQLLPAPYRGALLHAESGRRIIGAYPVVDDGAGFGSRIEELVYGGTDTWFRPSDVAVAPDGAVFIADWNDPSVGGHNTGDAQGTTGRIFRVAPPNHRATSPVVDLTSDDGLAAALGSPASAVRYLAHQELSKRGVETAPLLERMWRQSDPILKARALWLLGGIDVVGRVAIDEALAHPEARFRILGLRVARANGGDILSLSAPLLRDPSPQVRREIAILLRDTHPARMLPAYAQSSPQVTPPAGWLDAFAQLADQYDGQDRWYLEALAIAARGREDAIYERLQATADARSPRTASQLVWVMRPRAALPDLVATLQDEKRPVADRLQAADTIGAMEWPEATRAMESVILSPETRSEIHERAFTIYSRQLFSLWPDARNSAALLGVVRKGLSKASTQGAAVDLVGRLGDRQFLADIAAVIDHPDATPETRAAAIDLVSTTGDSQYLARMQALTSEGPVAVRVSAVRAARSLGPTDAHVWAQDIVLSDAPNEVRVEALRVMASSVAGLNAVLDLAAAGRVPGELRTLAATLTNNAAPSRGGGAGRGGFAPPPGAGGTQPAAVGGRGGPPQEYAAIRTRASEVLPLPTRAAGTIPNISTLERNNRGDAEAGRRVFQVEGACAACHGLGSARMLGPDLSAIGLKYGKQAMLDHIVRPNDAIGHEYVTTTFQLKSGETVSGIVTDDGPSGINLRIGETTERRLSWTDVVSRQPGNVSLMPEGLLDSLSLQQISDLLEFLSTLKGS